MSVTAPREVVLVHSSDLHLGTDNNFGPSCSSDALSVLRGVLVTATGVHADLLILCLLYTSPSPRDS